MFRWGGNKSQLVVCASSNLKRLHQEAARKAQLIPIGAIRGAKKHTDGGQDGVSVFKAGTRNATFKATMQNLAVTCFILSHAHFKEGMLIMSNKSAPAKQIT